MGLGTAFERVSGGMNVAIPKWQSRVSPVFDVAGELLLAQTRGRGVLARRALRLEDQDPTGRAEALKQAGVDVLICGAISWPMERAVAEAGIEVISQTCGDVECVLAAYLDGRLGQGAFLMPGCCGRRRRRGGGRRGRARGSQRK
jgi:predicted Fe-Mo cluster-binding NifX family protein